MGMPEDILGVGTGLCLLVHYHQKGDRIPFLEGIHRSTPSIVSQLSIVNRPLDPLHLE